MRLAFWILGTLAKGQLLNILGKSRFSRKITTNIEDCFGNLIYFVGRSSLSLNTATGGTVVSCSSFSRINPSVATSLLLINCSNILSHEKLTSDDEPIFSVASSVNL